ncbi:MAG: HPr family phosphocarrier protein [Lachnospiraceae bacterium]|jgi:phosphocarrier protein HPr|nr:HPr family phosphocarrier protein [Lachnospiraceae bacterium]
MVKQFVRVKNPTGLHLRPAGLLCREALRYQSSIRFLFGDSVVNAKSVLSVLGACIKSGDEIELVCDGADEDEAMRGVVALIEGGLGE